MDRPYPAGWQLDVAAQLEKHSKKDLYLDFKMDQHYMKEKTVRVRVEAKRTGDLLGYLSWHPEWRRYCFFPFCSNMLEVMFSEGCLESITAALRILTEDRESRMGGKP